MAFSLMEIYPLAQNNPSTENRDQIWIENFRNLHMKKNNLDIGIENGLDPGSTAFNQHSPLGRRTLRGLS